MNWKRLWVMLRVTLNSRLSLREDKAADEVIDEALRAGVEMRGSNLWVLMFAILIASIGLNVNSTAVIIGAMLISPLMGPILGVGYGVGINDLALIRTAFKNLVIASAIALLTSTVYFLISPLTTVQSELLARTSPTIWDVLVALFGGFAGIIGVTRREKSNVIPGVAIATALMPPLCTAGYGLASFNWHFFLGAFYLFFINCVFIALSAFLIIRAFHVRLQQQVDEQLALRMRRVLSVAVVLAVIPSLFLAYRLVQAELFKTRAAQFVRDELNLNQTHVTGVNVDPQQKVIEVTLIGETLPQERLAEIADRLPRRGLPAAKLKVIQADNQKVDITSLKASLLGDLYKESQVALSERDKTIQRLQTDVNVLSTRQERLEAIPAELHALFPQIQGIWLAETPEWRATSGMATDSTLVVNVRSTGSLSGRDRLRIRQWLETRLQTDRVKLLVEVER